MDSDNDLFSASLEAIETSKRVEIFQRFFTDFQRECEITLDNAQKWIKAELPIVTNHIDLAPLKDELKSNKTTTRRKHLLSALIFEQAARNAVHRHQAATSAMMTMQMINHIWQAKLVLYKTQPGSIQPMQTASHTLTQKLEKSKAEQEAELKKETILSSLVKKGELLKTESQVQQQNSSAIQASPKQNTSPKKTNVFTRDQNDLWAEAAKKERLKKLAPATKAKKPKRKTLGMLSKVRTKIPMMRKARNKSKETYLETERTRNSREKNPENSLLDNPNNSAIIVSPGFIKDIDDSLIQLRPDSSNDSNESGVTIRKVLKKRKHATHAPGGNTIIWKLTSSAEGRKEDNKSIPEQCQEAINDYCQQYPGYDIVAIRNMAAKEIGVSAQYIENLNILPERIN